MDKINWCKKQAKGLKLIEPNENLAKAYFKKAKSSLNMLSSAIEKKELEWIVSTAYYARYFAVYALFMKNGIKCEIHDCTIKAFRDLFEIKNMAEELEIAKKYRIKLQYYVSEDIDADLIIDNAKKAYEFVVKMEDYVEGFKKIEEIRERFMEL